MGKKMKENKNKLKIADNLNSLEQVETAIIKKKIKKNRILLIENDEDNRFIIKFILGKYDFEVVSASSGSTALDLVDKSFSIAIINNNIPDIGDTKLFTNLKSINSNIDLIVISDEYNREISEDIVIIKKPISAIKLLSAIERIFTRKKYTRHVKI